MVIAVSLKAYYYCKQGIDRESVFTVLQKHTCSCLAKYKTKFYGVSYFSNLYFSVEDYDSER